MERVTEFRGQKENHYNKNYRIMEKLHGMLNLSRIPKELITKNKNGEPCIWIDVIENKGGVDQYGNTHAVTIYDKQARKGVYIANLKKQEFGSATSAPATSQDDDDDLPEFLR